MALSSARRRTTPTRRLNRPASTATIPTWIPAMQALWLAVYLFTVTGRPPRHLPANSPSRHCRITHEVCFFFSFHFPPYLIHFLSPKNFELPIAPPIGDGHSSPPSESHSGRFLSGIIDSTLETDLVVTRCDGTRIGSRWQKSPESLAGCPFPRQECFLVG